MVDLLKYKTTSTDGSSPWLYISKETYIGVVTQYEIIVYKYSYYLKNKYSCADHSINASREFF